MTKLLCVLLLLSCCVGCHVTSTVFVEQDWQLGPSEPGRARLELNLTRP